MPLFTKFPRQSLSSRTFLLVAALACAAPAFTVRAAEDAPINWTKDGKWSPLTRYIGTYDYEGVMGDKDVKKALDAMLKGHDDIDLKNQFAVTAPIGFENDCLILKGNPAQKADVSRAYMNVCVKAGTIHLALWNAGKIDIFTASAEYEYLPEGLRQWVYLQNPETPDMMTKPGNVQLNK